MDDRAGPLPAVTAEDAHRSAAAASTRLSEEAELRDNGRNGMSVETGYAATRRR